MATRAMSDPWQEMRRLQREMEHLFADSMPAWRWPLTGEYPPVNVTRHDNQIVVDALCPGVDRATLDITVLGEAMMIRGERKPEPGVSEERYHRRERPLGTFTRTLTFGDRLDPDRTRATYRHGILRVELAGAPETQPKKIPIQA